MARRNDLPEILSRVDDRGVPRAAVMVVGAVAAVVAATGALDAVAAAAALTILVYYGITNVAALRLGAAERWLPAWVPAFGALACATLALSLDLRTIVIGLAVLMAGVLARVLQHR